MSRYRVGITRSGVQPTGLHTCVYEVDSLSGRSGEDRFDTEVVVFDRVGPGDSLKFVVITPNVDFFNVPLI